MDYKGVCNSNAKTGEWLAFQYKNEIKVEENDFKNTLKYFSEWFSREIKIFLELPIMVSNEELITYLGKPMEYYLMENYSFFEWEFVNEHSPWYFPFLNFKESLKLEVGLLDGCVFSMEARLNDKSIGKYNYLELKSVFR
ncbi:hypothetical protein [Parashewanella curva]|nr:hypothetical protein [Parashewanella curva]